MCRSRCGPATLDRAALESCLADTFHRVRGHVADATLDDVRGAVPDPHRGG
jgi:hypothetical protein